MLLGLHVKNLALIDEAEVEFGKGLNILTGETGAGKSILIGSINLALGEKAPKDIIRRDTEYALVELLFGVESEETENTLRMLDIFPEGGEVLLTRKITRTRSICRINGETVPVSALRRAASALIDIHGQQEHQSLLSKKNHLKYLDDYASDVLGEEKKRLAEEYSIWRACRDRLKEASSDEKERERELSFLRFEENEISAANLVLGEDEELEALYRKLQNGRKIMEAAGGAYDMTGSGRESASDAIGRALGGLLKAGGYDEDLDALTVQLEEIDSLLNDFNRDLSAYLADADFSEELFAQTGERLDEINRLKSKYGSTIGEILRQQEIKEARIMQLEDYENWRTGLERELAAAEKILGERSEAVSKARKEAAKTFESEIRQSLQDLNFMDVQFELRFDALDHYTANGIDDARFFISTNPGEELRPLEKTASGGELSRIMLAIKTVLAEKDDVDTLIFDEIDAGISGRTAQMVAQKLKATAEVHQVICITHLPQIASMADCHYLIEKSVESNTTVSGIHLLQEEESVQELARMMGGARITETVIESAREMKRLASGIEV